MILQPGEYSQPLTRVQPVQVPVVSGYTTARLRARTETPSGYVDQPAHVTLENTGTVAATLQLRQTDDHVNGPRVNLGAAQAVVPGGRVEFDVYPTAKYLELHCTANGPTTVRMQLAGKQQWDVLGFSKTDPLYPTVLWQPKSFGTADTATW